VNPITAWYFNDPGCPWGYSARPALARLRWRYGDQLDWRLVLIGLTEDPSLYESRGYTPARAASGNRSYQERFGMPFATAVKPRMWATSRACRAIVAAREQSAEFAVPALHALQLMQFTTAGLLDDDEALRAALETVEGLDAAAAVARIDDPALIEVYEADRARARTADGRPIHVQGRHAESDGPVRYTAPSVIFEKDDGTSLEVGGFQSFDSYDNALANLAPELDRRPAPESVVEVVEFFPHGVTTAEVAEVMRSGDTAAIDLDGVERELVAAVGDGALVGTPAGTDGVWRSASAVGASAPDALAAA
jgi:predicted DsbA family dithiol-disulfide isomerase